MSAHERRAALLEAATRVMRRDGVHAATTRAVTTEAGMPVSTFHYCFASRAEMLETVIVQLAASERRAVFEALVPGEQLADTLRAAVEGYLAHLRSDPGQEQMLLELTQAALRDPELAPLARRQYREYYATASGVLEQAAAVHGVTWSLPVRTLARLVITVVDGLTTTWLADRNTRGTRAVAGALVEQLSALARPPARP